MFSFFVFLEESQGMRKVTDLPLPGETEAVLLMSWKLVLTGKGCCLVQGCSPPDQGLLSSGFLLVTAVLTWQGSGKGKTLCWALTSSAYTSTSWDSNFGLNMNPVVCEFVCFGQIITSCFLEVRASFPSPGSRSLPSSRNVWGKQNKRGREALPLSSPNKLGGVRV